MEAVPRLATNTRAVRIKDNGGDTLTLPCLASEQGKMVPSGATDHVAILLSTYNGAEFLAAQLDSLIAQTHVEWTIFASDDGSSDATREILNIYQKRLNEGRLVILEGPHRGFAANFLSLLSRDTIKASYYAFCDQDDCWAPNRLEKGLDWIRQISPEVPALFCSRTRLIDVHNRPVGFSPLFRRPPCFENALVQSIAGGNTMLFNAATRNLLAQTRDSSEIVSHDWWAYILVTGCGGQVAYEKEPTIDYRQHGHNIVGSNASLRERGIRLRKMFQGTFRAWTDDNLRALGHFRDRLTQENRRTLELFEQGRRSSLIGRLSLIHRSGIHRQTLADTLGLAAAIILQRV